MHRRTDEYVAGEQRTVTVLPEHLAESIEFFKANPDANKTSGCLMNMALRDEFPEGRQYDQGAEGNSFYSTSAVLWDRPDGENWQFDHMGTWLVHGFDENYYGLLNGDREYPISLPQTVTLTRLPNSESF